VLIKEVAAEVRAADEKTASVDALVKEGIFRAKETTERKDGK
jgi:hypothetical protein